MFTACVQTCVCDKGAGGGNPGAAKWWYVLCEQFPATSLASPMAATGMALEQERTRSEIV